MIRPVFGTMRFDMPGDSDYIPANPTRENTRLDPNRRDPALKPAETLAQWRSQKPRWSFSMSSGELESPYVLLDVDGREINRVLALARERHGKDAVKSIVLWVAPEGLDDNYPTLLHWKFSRAGHRETKIPQLCFVGPAKCWKV
jgi:hypothetical protein